MHYYRFNIFNVIKNGKARLLSIIFDPIWDPVMLTLKKYKLCLRVERSVHAKSVHEELCH